MRKTQKIVSTGIALAVILAFGIAGPAAAVDGVLEINQTCAVNTGCFPGDTAGFPVQILTAGSYRLTSNLEVPDANTTAIQAPGNGTDVTIDLNGFGLIGPTVCSGSPISCDPTGTGRGVSNAKRLSIRNGIVKGMGSQGIWTQDSAIIQNVQFESNGGNGIEVYGHSLIEGNRMQSNGGLGISAGAFSNLFGNVVTLNLTGGIQCDWGSCNIKENTVTYNGGTGIDAGSNTIAVENNLYNNDGDGISCSHSCSVIGNKVSTSGGVGLALGNYSGYVNNVVRSSGGAEVTGGIELGSNICGFDLVCP